MRCAAAILQFEIIQIHVTRPVPVWCWLDTVASAFEPAAAPPHLIQRFQLSRHYGLDNCGEIMAMAARNVG